VSFYLQHAEFEFSGWAATLEVEMEMEKGKTAVMSKRRYNISGAGEELLLI